MRGHIQKLNVDTTPLPEATTPRKVHIIEDGGLIDIKIDGESLDLSIDGMVTRARLKLINQEQNEYQQMKQDIMEDETDNSNTTARSYWTNYLNEDLPISEESIHLNHCYRAIYQTNIPIADIEHQIANKTRIHSDENPTLGMLRKNDHLRDKWAPAIQSEVKGMAMTQVSKQEAYQQGITPHVTLLTTKRDGKLKARINIDGRYELWKGYFPDKDELYAPAMDEEIFKIIIAHAAYHKMKLTSSDVRQCFQNNTMVEAKNQRIIIIHLTQLECGISEGAYYRMNAVGYGCADASREWYDRLRKELENLGMQRSLYHPCLFTMRKGEGLLILGIATDDLLKANTTNAEGRELAKYITENLDKKWKMTHKDQVDEFIGINIIYAKEGHMTIRQDSEISKIQAKFLQTIDEPKTYSLLKRYEDEKDLEIPVDSTTYRSRLGSLGYIRMTRNDIKRETGVAAQSQNKPTKFHNDRLQHIAKYIWSTKDVGLTFRTNSQPQSTRIPIPVHASSDASWGESHSTLAWTVTMGPYLEPSNHNKYQAPIVAKTMKENDGISDSCPVAELKAMMKAVAAVLVVRGIHEEIAGIADNTTMELTPIGMAPPTTVGGQNIDINSIKQPISTIDDNIPPSTIIQDNRSLLQTVIQDTTNKGRKLRKVARWINYLQNVSQQKLIAPIKVKSKDQLSNIMTKYIPSMNEHWRQVEYIQGSNETITTIQKQVAEKATRNSTKSK
jgi:hypothetical protein